MSWCIQYESFIYVQNLTTQNLQGKNAINI